MFQCATCCNATGGDSEILQEAIILDQQPAIPSTGETVPQQEVVETEQAAPPQAAVEAEKEQQVEEKTQVVEEKPSPPLPAAELVRLVFSTADGEKSVDLLRRPIGLWFTKSVPMKVVRVGKKFAAAAAGIQENWTMISVNGEDISKPSMDYANALAILDKHVKNLPEDTSNGKSVVFVFSCDGNDATFKAQWSPLGVKFEKQQMPITVTDAGLYGGLLGIKPGMVFKSVGGTDVSTCGSYDAAIALLKESMKVLPEMGSSEVFQSQVSCR
jgi:hypothetical protein